MTNELLALKEEIKILRRQLDERASKNKFPSLKCALTGKWLVDPVRLLADGKFYDAESLSLFLCKIKKNGGRLTHSPGDRQFEITNRKQKLKSETQFCPECRLIKEITNELMSNKYISH